MYRPTLPGHDWQTDRQTDGRTDRHIQQHSPRRAVPSIARKKNRSWSTDKNRTSLVFTQVVSSRYRCDCLCPFSSSLSVSVLSCTWHDGLSLRAGRLMSYYTVQCWLSLWRGVMAQLTSTIPGNSPIRMAS